MYGLEKYIHKQLLNLKGNLMTAIDQRPFLLFVSYLGHTYVVTGSNARARTRKGPRSQEVSLKTKTSTHTTT
jgi:hypothetical protein